MVMVSVQAAARTGIETATAVVGRRARGRRRAGFTLLEALLAMGLMLALLSSVFAFYMGVLRSREVGNTMARDTMLAHALLQQMANEIRHAADIVPGDGIGFSGTKDRITIVRVGIPERYAFDRYDSIHEQLPPAQLDLRRITYELIRDEELRDEQGNRVIHGLLRSEQKTFNPNPSLVIQTSGEDDLGEDTGPGTAAAIPVERELVAPEVKYLLFEYFDGAEWRDRWQTAQEQAAESGEELAVSTGGDGGSALPQAVRITIGRIPVPEDEEEFNITQLREMEERRREDRHHPDRYTVVVYLHQADQSMLSSRKYGVKNNPDLQTGG